MSVDTSTSCPPINIIFPFTQMSRDKKKKKYKGHSCTMELLIEPFHIHAQDPLGILGNKLNWEEWKEMEKHFTKKLMM